MVWTQLKTFWLGRCSALRWTFNLSISSYTKILLMLQFLLVSLCRHSFLNSINVSQAIIIHQQTRWDVGISKWKRQALPLRISSPNFHTWITFLVVSVICWLSWVDVKIESEFFLTSSYFIGNAIKNTDFGKDRSQFESCGSTF